MCSPRLRTGYLFSASLSLKYLPKLLRIILHGLRRWLNGKESACQWGDPGNTGSIPGLGRSPGLGNGSPLQYSCLENSMDRGAWWAAVHRVAKSKAQLSMHACTYTHTFCMRHLSVLPYYLCNHLYPYMLMYIYFMLSIIFLYYFAYFVALTVPDISFELFIYIWSS